MFSAGRVLLMPKGAYNPLTTYEMLDIVSYNGSSYIAKGTTTGNLPTDTTYWQLSAYGGQAANIAGNFAELESSSVATATHYVDDIFVDENSQLMKATQTINIGDTIDANVNCAPTTVEALIAYLSSYVDSLDSLNKKIQGAIEIAAQTDLHSLAIGEYYKKQTTFYVTNGPTGIDQDPTAIFRLTVEAALDNASQASSPLLLTLRTPDGKIYTQSFDGTNWGSWVEVASAASVSALNTAKQPKTLDTPITVGGVQQTTVEGALGSINQTLTNNKLSKKLITSVDDMPASKDFYDFEDGAYYLGAGVVHGTGVVNAPPITNGCSMYVNTNGVYKVFSVYPYSFANAEQEPMYIACASSSANMKWTSAVTQNQITNPNLLDNPWFTVNQRGQSNYSNTDSVNHHTWDRWYISDVGSAISKSSDVMTFSTSVAYGAFMQKLELDAIEIGKTYTLSVRFSDETIESKTFTTIDGSASLNSAWGKASQFSAVVTNQYSSQWQIIVFNHGNKTSSDSVSIKAIKLELGSVSTLAQDTAPNYATELLKCQRYFYRLQSDNSYGLLSDLGYVNSTSDVRVPIILPVPMRAKPSVSASGALRVFNAIDNNSMSTAVTLITPLHSIEGTLGHLRVTATNSDFVSGKIVALAANNDDNAYIDLSADL